MFDFLEHQFTLKRKSRWVPVLGHDTYALVCYVRSREDPLIFIGFDWRKRWVGHWSRISLCLLPIVLCESMSPKPTIIPLSWTLSPWNRVKHSLHPILWDLRLAPFPLLYCLTLQREEVKCSSYCLILFHANAIMPISRP